MQGIYHFENFYLLDIWIGSLQDEGHAIRAVAVTQEADVMSGSISRILCLHGYHGSGAILRDQMESLTAALPASIEFV